MVRLADIGHPSPPTSSSPVIVRSRDGCGIGRRPFSGSRVQESPLRAMCMYRLRFWLVAEARLSGAMAQFKNIRRHKSRPAVKRFARRIWPEDDSIGASSTTPGQSRVQQSFANSLVPNLRDDIAVSYISMKLQFVNRIRDFLKQLHADMAEQLFPLFDHPAAPWGRAFAKTLLHP